MRSLRLLLPLAAVAALVVAASSSTAVAASTTKCSGSVSGGFWTHITATNVTCSNAKSLIKKWIKKVNFGQVDPPPSTTVGAFTCKIKFAGSQGESGKLTCTASGGRKVTTVGHP
jgi:hypothetical protein